MGKKILMEIEENKKVCKRCEELKTVNEIGLCKKCSEEVEYEYSLLYMSQARFMEY